MVGGGRTPEYTRLIKNPNPFSLIGICVCMYVCVCIIDTNGNIFVVMTAAAVWAVVVVLDGRQKSRSRFGYSNCLYY